MPRSYRRPLLALGLAAAAGWAVAVRLRPPEPPAESPPAPFRYPSWSSLAAEERRAKALPEYAELRVPPPKKGEVRPTPTDAQITRLIELTDHPNAWIQFLAAHRLSEVTGPRRDEAVGRIAAQLTSPHPMHRVGAMNLLATAKATDRIPDLLPFLDSPDEDERSAARRALDRLGHPTGP